MKRATKASPFALSSARASATPLTPARVSAARAAAASALSNPDARTRTVAEPMSWSLQPSAARSEAIAPIADRQARNASTAITNSSAP